MFTVAFTSTPGPNTQNYSHKANAAQYFIPDRETWVCHTNFADKLHGMLGLQENMVIQTIDGRISRFNSTVPQP